MFRLIAGTVSGAVVWFVAVLVLGFLCRIVWPEMAAIRDMMLLTLPMLITRLAISALGSVAGGYAAAMVARENTKAPLAAGILLLVVFVPYHLTIWQNFPVWYHVTFFVSLPVLSLLGGLVRSSPRLKPRIQ
ncbi:MAG TPA: hypothetical protein VNB30_00690 [Rhizomicrobium sp.]|jgi:hypothetical protein|nr:hypothetical protein [Rhizomicrobium sp.]